MIQPVIQAPTLVRTEGKQRTILLLPMLPIALVRVVLIVLVGLWSNITWSILGLADDVNPKRRHCTRNPSPNQRVRGCRTFIIAMILSSVILLQHV